MATLTRSSRGRAFGRGLAAAASIGLCIYGAASLTQGLAVPVTAELGQAQLERQFERRLAQNFVSPVRPMPSIRQGHSNEPARRPARTDAAPASTGPALLRLGVARLGVSEIVRSGLATHDTLKRGPMMIKRGDAASPVTILSAHRDTHFLFVRDLQQDDVVTLQSDAGEVERYRVIGFETVRWNEFSYPLDPARPLLALATCYPFGGTEYGGPWRRVAWAEKMES
jgi:sortase A